MKYELTIYLSGVAILTDDAGETLWTSDGDDEFAQEFDEIVSMEDADDIVAYLEVANYLPDGVALNIRESDDEELDDDEDEDDSDESRYNLFD